MNRRLAPPVEGSWPLSIPLRGSRDYLRGADMYSAVIDRLFDLFPGAEAGPFSMTFRRIARSHVDMVLAPGRPDRREALAEFSLPEAGIAGSLVASPRPHIERGACPQETIDKHVLVSGRTARVQREISASPIEIITTMAKRVHVAAMPRTQWLMTRLELSRHPESADAPKLALTLAHDLRGRCRLTRSEIYAGDERLGRIFVSIASRP